MAKEYKNGPTKCQKHFRKQCDLNTIMRKHKFNMSGLLSNPAFPMPDKLNYVDFTSADDLQTTSNKVALLKTGFEKMPIDIKNFFENDVGNYIDFMYNVSNPDKDKNTRDEAIKLGLVPKIESKDQIKHRLINEGVEAAEIAAAVQKEMEIKYPTAKSE